MIKSSKLIGYIIFFSFYLYSCSNQNNRSIELQVYNDIITELVNVDYGIIPVPPPPGNKLDSIIYLKKLEAYGKRMDTLQKIILIKDSLVSIKNSDYQYLSEILNVKNVDFLNIMLKYSNLKERTGGYLDVSKINLNGVKLIPITDIVRDSTELSIFNSNDFVFGQIVISKVLFDDDYQRGILNFNFFCRMECGFGQFILVEKINGKWIVIDKIDDWIM